MSQQYAGAQDDTELVTLQDAADILGVHYMTAYRYVRSGQLHATKHDGRWMVAPGDLEAFTNRDRTSPAGRRLPIEERRSRLRARLLAGDGPGAWAIVEDALRASVDSADVLTEMILPIMHDIGEDWHGGTVTIAQEHTATAVARRLVARLGPVDARRGRRRGAVVLGAVSRDHHDLGVAVLANLLRGEGYEARDLGGDVPTEAFVETLQQADRVVAVVLSWSAPGREREVRETIAALREQGVPVVVGGPASSREVVEDLGALHAPSMADAIDVLETL